MLTVIVLGVLAVLLLVGRMYGDMKWQHVLALFLDPGNYDGPGVHEGFRITIALLGVFLFSALLVSVFTNIIENISSAYKRGENHYRFKNHILIIGAGRSMMTMLSSIRKHPDLCKDDILIMTSEDVVPLREKVRDSLADKRFCRKITFYHSDRLSKQHLMEACAHHAKIIYLLGEEGEDNHDANNIQCLNFLREICAQDGPDIQCYMTIEMHTSLDVIRYLKSADSSRLCVEVISESDYIVEQLLVHTDILPVLTEKDTDKRLRVVIAGHSRESRSFARIASLLCHFPNFKDASNRTQIVFIHPGMETQMDRFVANHRGIFDLCHYHYVSSEKTTSFAPKKTLGDFIDQEWTFVDAEMSSPFARSLMEEWIDDPSETLLFAICSQDDERGLSTALHLPQKVYDSGCPILLYQKENLSLANAAVKSGMFGGLFVFGDNQPGVDALFLQRTTWGKRTNRVYDLEYGNPPAQDADSAWKRLPHAHKLSSISSANFFPIIMRCFGLKATKECFSALSEDVLDRISEAEHRHWMSSVLLLGYTAAETEIRKDRESFRYLKKEKFIHLDIAPYNELQHEQKKDMLLVNHIPFILTGESKE